MHIRRPKIMKEEDFKHVWVLSPNVWWIKFFLWMYGANEREVTFCRLFWGYTMTPVLLLPRTVVGILGMWDDAYVASRNDLRRHKLRRELAIRASLPMRWRKAAIRPRLGSNVVFALDSPTLSGVYPRSWILDGEELIGVGSSYVLNRSFNTPGKHLLRVVMSNGEHLDHDFVVRDRSWAMRTIDKVSDKFSALKMWLSAHPKIENALGWLPLAFVVTVLGSLIAILITLFHHGLALAGLWVYHAVLNLPHITVQGAVAVAHAVISATALDVVIVVGVVCAIVGGITGIAYLLLQTDRGINFCDALMERLLHSLGRFGKKGGLSFARMFLIGYKGVKSNTCPRVVIDR